MSTNIAHADSATYEKFLDTGQYPELFSQAEMDLGGRKQLIDLTRDLLIGDATRTSDIYATLARWPFPVYLTTNFDDAIKSHLEGLGIHYTTLTNTRSDASQVRADATHLIFKLHGDLAHIETVVLTSNDYSQMMFGPDRDYLRQKLLAVFSMCDIFIIGHSLSDPDLRMVIQTAKQSASLDKPIYMAMANVTKGEVREFNEKYNIQVIPYDDVDHSHSSLKRILRAANHFICDRHSTAAINTPVDTADIEAATSLFLYRQMQAAVGGDFTRTVFSPLVLRTLRLAGRPMTLQQLLGEHPMSLLASRTNCEVQVAEAIAHLERIGQVRDAGSDKYSLTEDGKEQVDSVATRRQIERDQSLGQFELDLRVRYPKLTSGQALEARSALDEVLAQTYSSRGLELANVVIAMQSLQPGRLKDLFASVTEAAVRFEDADLRAAFVDVAGHFLLEPDTPQRKYLASLSQGFFIFHLAGLDPTCARLRVEILNRTAWFLDSSVFLPLLAKGCQNHEYAVDFVKKLQGCGTASFATRKILREAFQHLIWAMRFIRDHGDDTAELLAYAMAKGEYKQNLFIDGYIGMSAEGNVATFADYLQRTLPYGVTLPAIQKMCSDYGVRTLQLDELEGFEQNDWGEIPSLRSSLKTERQNRGTYRGFRQVDAEAEILLIIRYVRNGKYTLPVPEINMKTVYFVSHSRILDVVDVCSDITTWSPEAVYRYLSTLPGATTDPKLLQECMLGEFFNVGIQVIDRSRYVAFFGPAINQARLSFEEQKEKYIESTVHFASLGALEEAFSKTPDLEKPFFVSRMGWQIAEKAQNMADEANALAKQAQHRAEAAEAMATKAEAERRVAEKARRRAESEANRLRNLMDPKHIRKRERQAKKRLRKKKKGK